MAVFAVYPAFMTFGETYREELLITRRSRARKARLAGRIIGFGLMACFVVALRSDPQLRGLVEDLALRAMGGGSQGQAPGGDVQARAIGQLGYKAGSEEARVLDQLGITGTQRGTQTGTAPDTSRMPQSRIKINRPPSQ